jgi:hypothetical protein
VVLSVLPDAVGVGAAVQPATAAAPSSAAHNWNGRRDTNETLSVRAETCL